MLWVAIDSPSKWGSLPSILELTMNVGADKSEPLTAIHTDLGAIFVSLELSRSSWLITSLSPGGGDKMSKHSVRGGDFAGLMQRFAQLQEKAALCRLASAVIRSFCACTNSLAWMTKSGAPGSTTSPSIAITLLARPE